MNARRCLTTLTLALVAACSPGGPEPEPQSSWVGTSSTEGNVTTVVNESGSVWGGTATLVEEASIGVEAGDAHYVFGSIASMWATDDLIYVLDRQVPALRAFDHDGNWVRDIGRPGQGPGEFQRPDTVMVAEDGRVFIFETRSSRMDVYSTSGEPLATWSLGAYLGQNPELAADGRVLLWHMEPGDDGRPETDDDLLGLQQIAAGGAVGDFIPSPVRTSEVRTPSVVPEPFYVSLPFGRSHRTAFSSMGAFVSGDTGAYAFELRSFDGTVVRVERYWDPVPVPAGLAEHYRRRIVASFQARQPGWSWDGAEIPTTKRAFESISVDREGRVLLFREGESSRRENCEDDPTNPSDLPLGCWEAPYFWDVFEPGGKYLGRVDSPAGWVAAPFVRGDLWLMRMEDEAGTIMVKRYRLELPGGEAP